ncbi:MAG: hypothetical protein RL264_2369 [Bacteroidota bacterium]|jgi:hypothetical protein
MLFAIEDKLISTEIFSKKFVCDLNACKGACCVEGDQGAPLKDTEVEFLTQNLELIKPFMRQVGIDAVEKNGVSYIDSENMPVTTLVNGAECAFVFFDQGVAKCSIEQAYREGVIAENKPLSCHLYPIRVKKFGEYQALNFEEWKICEPACACGDKLDLPVYRFLKEPLVRAYGESFFHELTLVDKEFQNR